MDALSSARKIPPSSRSNTGYVPSGKVSCGFASYESRLERDFYLLLNHDPSISQFQPQPETILWTNPERNQTRKYTPDVLVITALGKRFLFEIKMESNVRTNFLEYRSKWMAADVTAKKRGWKFGIVTEKMIRTPRLQNVWFCLGSSRAFQPDVRSAVGKLLCFVKEFRDGIGYRQLCMETAQNLGTPLEQAALLACYAIYHGLVYDDTFSTMSLDAKTVIRAVSQRTRCFSPLMDEIKAYTVETIYSSKENLCEDASVPNLEVAMRPFPQVPPKYEDIVEEREIVVKQWLGVPSRLRTLEWRKQFTKRVGFSYQTVTTWGKRYLQEGVEGLIPRSANAGRPRIFPSQSLEILGEYRKIFLEKSYSTIKGAYSRFVTACEEKEVPAVSYSTFLRFVKSLPASKFALAKKGRTWWKQHFRPALDTFRDAILPLQVVEIDNTPFDVFPVDSEEREPLAPPHLIAALDVHSRMITGYCLTFDHPSRLTALEVLAMTILSKDERVETRQTANPWPIEGLPVMVLVDNGMDFRAEDVKKFCLKYGIILEFAPVRTPEYKANIEQWFEVLKKDLKNEGVPGFRPSLRQRKEMPETDPADHASLTLEDLDRWLISWIVDTYHERTMQKGHVPSPLTVISEAKRGRTPLPLPSPVTLPAVDQKKVK